MSKGPSEKVKGKGRRLLREKRVKKKLETARRCYFDVRGETEKHSVLFNKTKDMWSCSCKYNSMKNRECSHIYACKLMIEKD